MTPDNFALLEAWFDEASGLTGPERARIFRAAEDTDPALAEELRRMLAEFDRETNNPVGHWPAVAAPPAFTARSYGPWHAERVIGRGGMGAVFLARRIDGQYEREVALKVLAPHLVDESFQQRFLAERRILATLNHPNITHMLDGGVAEDGSPYLVMEYVDGEDIRTYCNQRRLSPAERVRLFGQVCAAVSYAHQRLVLHRDLKPSNIMVTAGGHVRLLDFGAAKLLGGGADGLTLTGASLMTPRYASPEQMQQQPVGTPSDIYSLGIVLYELLAGVGPFGEAQTPLDDFLRMAENRSPAPLGEILGANAAAERSTTGELLRRTLTGDLRQILGKCLQADPLDRYVSVDALSRDLEAWLDNRPITARPLTIAYRARKFARRNWGKLALAALVLVAIGAGVAGTLWQSRLAEKRFQEVRSLARYQMFELFDGLMAFEGAGTLRQNLVERSMQYLDALSRDAGRDKVLREEIAEGYLRLGNLFANAGFADPRRNERARQSYEKGRAMARGLDTPAGRRTLAMIELGAGTMSISALKPEVTAAAQRAMTAIEAAIQAAPSDPKNYLYLGDVLTMAGEKLRSASGMLDGSPEGLPNYDRALDAYRNAERLGADPNELKRAIWRLYARQAFVLSSTNPRKSIEVAELALGEIQKEPEAVRRDARIMRLESQFYSDIGWASGQALLYDQGIEASRKSIALQMKMLDQDPGNLRLLYDLTANYRALGILHGYAKRPREAITAFEQAIEYHSRILAAGPNTQSEFLRAELTARTGNLWLQLGDRSRALTATRAAEAGLRKLCDRPDPNPSHLLYLANMLTNNPLVANPVDSLRFARAANAKDASPIAREALAQALIVNNLLDEADQVLTPLEERARATSGGKPTRQLDALQTARDELNRRRAALARR